jgi:YD repeat-containing protein
VNKIIIFLLLTSFYNRVFGQTLKIIPPTPNAMKMTEYYAQRPNMYTGTANTTIPLHTIDFDGMNLPLSVSYNATGIRTNEEAGEVGLGWALNATGVISRVIKGKDDLFKGGANLGKGYVYNDKVITYDLGWDQKSNTFPSNLSYYFHLAIANPDTQPDTFNYNFFGYSGSFVLSQKAANPLDSIKVIKITQDACKIVFNEGATTFTVITPNGYRGEFTVKEKSTSFSSQPSGSINRMICCGQDKIDIDQMINNGGRIRTTTSWYLTKVTSPRGQVITFNYDLRTHASDAIVYEPSYTTGEVYSPYISNSRAFAEFEFVSSPETCLQTVQEHVYLKSIVSNEIMVDFLMEDREDLRRNYLFAPDSSARRVFHRSENLKRYKEISIKGLDPSSTLNKKITMKQGYFNQQYQDPYVSNQNEREVQWLRSRLDRLTIDDQEYQFFYEKGQKGIPNKMTNGIDHFGFYNGQDQLRRLLPPQTEDNDCNLSDTTRKVSYSQLSERRVDFSYGIAGILNKVVYPTRGWTTFEYEAHKYQGDTLPRFRELGEHFAGGARIKSVREFDFSNALVPVKSKTYVYTENSQISSSPTTGLLMTPLYNRYINYLHEGGNQNLPISGCYFLLTTNSSIPGNNSAEGKAIGYTKVHEIVSGLSDSYKNTYKFENTPNKVSNWNLSVVAKPNLNGQLIETKNYDKSSKVVQLIKNSDYEHNIDEIKSIAYVNQYRQDQPGVSPFFIYYTFNPIQRVFHTPYVVTTTTTATPSGLIEDANGNISGSALVSRRELVYNTFVGFPDYKADYLLLEESTTNSKNELTRTRYLRPLSYLTSTGALGFMKANNIIEPVIEQIVYRNSNVISATGNLYGLSQNGSRVDLKSSYEYNRGLGGFIPSTGTSFAAPYEKKVDYTYDDVTGNILEYKGSDDVFNSFLWGYNNKLPIARGIGVTQSQLSTAHIAASTNPATYETTLRNSLSGKQVITYDHNPLVGVLKMTDPSGFKRLYQYDTYGRLKKVLDNDSKTLEQYDYHFRERQPTRILNLTANLNFGVLTPDMFAAQFTPYARCSDGLRSRVLTLTNDGEDDLQISSIAVVPYTSAFSFSWQGGEIAAGTSVDVVISGVMDIY